MSLCVLQSNASLCLVTDNEDPDDPFYYVDLCTTRAVMPGSEIFIVYGKVAPPETLPGCNPVSDVAREESPTGGTKVDQPRKARRRFVKKLKDVDPEASEEPAVPVRDNRSRSRRTALTPVSADVRSGPPVDSTRTIVDDDDADNDHVGVIAERVPLHDGPAVRAPACPPVDVEDISWSEAAPVPRKGQGPAAAIPDGKKKRKATPSGKPVSPPAPVPRKRQGPAAAIADGTKKQKAIPSGEPVSPPASPEVVSPVDAATGSTDPPSVDVHTGPEDLPSGLSPEEPPPPSHRLASEPVLASEMSTPASVSPHRAGDQGAADIDHGNGMLTEPAAATPQHEPEHGRSPTPSRSETPPHRVRACLTRL